jgi:hypothetical protein
MRLLGTRRGATPRFEAILASLAPKKDFAPLPAVAGSAGLAKAFASSECDEPSHRFWETKSFPEDTDTAHRRFVRHFHRELALRLNRIDTTPGRRVMCEFWDAHLTFEKSWLAQLKYVHQDAVKHGSVTLANQYPWCSAPWFETNARSGFVKSVYSFKTDRINVPDDF